MKVADLVVALGLAVSVSASCGGDDSGSASSREAAIPPACAQGCNEFESCNPDGFEATFGSQVACRERCESQLLATLVFDGEECFDAGRDLSSCLDRPGCDGLTFDPSNPDPQHPCIDEIRAEQAACTDDDETRGTKQP